MYFDQSSKISDFNKLISKKKFNRIFLITGKNSYYKSKANSFGVKLAGLETKILKEGFYDYIKAEVYDVIMPDIKYAGGPDEMLEIEKTLNEFRIDFSPHNPSGPISYLHSMQICASTEKESLMEYQYKESPLFNSLMHRSIPEINQGKSLIPNFNYGLGMSLNKKQLASLSWLFNYFLFS